MINNITYQNIPLIKVIEKTQDGKVIVDVKSMEDNSYNRNIVPEENLDKFEKIITEFHDKYEPYTRNHFAKGNIILHLTTMASATIGGAITAACLKPDTKASRKFFKVAGGAIGGWLASAAILSAVLLKTIFNYAKKGKELGVQHIPMLKSQQPDTEQKPQAPVNKVDTEDNKETEKVKEVKENTETEETKAE